MDFPKEDVIFSTIDNNEDHSSSYYNLLSDWNHYLEEKGQRGI